MSAKEMFEKLGYEYYEKDSRIKGKIPIYTKEVIDTHYTNVKKITFALNGYETEEYVIDNNTGERIKTIDNVFINTQELQAINKYFDELGGNND